MKGTTNPTGPQQHPSSFDSPTFHFAWGPHVPLETGAQGTFFSKRLPNLPVNRLLHKEGCFYLRIQSCVLWAASSDPCFEWAAKAPRFFEKALIYSAFQKQRKTRKALDAKHLLSWPYIARTTGEIAYICQRAHQLCRGARSTNPSLLIWDLCLAISQSTFRPVFPLHWLTSFPRI